MPRKRARGFILEAGVQATQDALVKILMPFAMILRVDMYASISFTTGVDKARLQQFLPMLMELVRLDVRGGFYNQKMLIAVIVRVMADDESWSKHLVEQGKSISEGHEMVAYKLRLMLAHVRLGQSLSMDTDTASPLDPLYEIITQSEKRNAKRPRIAHRPHPFFNFRSEADDLDDAAAADDDDDDDDAQDDNSPTVVSRFFDHGDYKAKLLKSDGTLLLADTYEPLDGFVRALWLHDGSHLDTQILAEAIIDFGTTPAGGGGGGQLPQAIQDAPQSVEQGAPKPRAKAKSKKEKAAAISAKKKKKKRRRRQRRKRKRRR